MIGRQKKMKTDCKHKDIKHKILVEWTWCIKTFWTYFVLTILKCKIARLVQKSEKLNGLQLIDKLKLHAFLIKFRAGDSWNLYIRKIFAAECLGIK